MKKTKHFNSKMYETENKIKTAFIILVVFLIGMYIGVVINYLEIQNKEMKIKEQYIEIENLKETIEINRYQQIIESKQEV